MFTAASDDEALRTLRLTEMELIVKEIVGPSRDLTAFIASARHLCPTSVVVCIMTPGADTVDGESEAEAADFVLLEPFTSRQLQSLLKQADDKLHLLQEVAALRAARNPAAPGALESLVDGPPPSPQAATQMAKEFAKALAAGFDLPRVLDQFLDGVGEMARPSRAAILLAGPESHLYRVAAYRGLAPHVVESLTLAADSGLPLWLATEGRLIHIEQARSHSAEPAAREIARELAALQSVVAIPLARTASWSGSDARSAHHGRRVWAAGERPCSISRPTWPPPCANQVHHQLQSRRSSTSGSSPACRAGWSPSVATRRW